MLNKLLNRIKTKFDASFTILVASLLIAIIATSCSVFNRGKSSDKGSTDLKSLKTEPTFHHGFGGDPDTFKLIDRMNTKELAILVNDEEAAKKIKTNPKPSLIYTGKSLSLSNCEIAPQNANHISELWNQDYLMSLFIPKENGIKKAIESLQEADATSIFRPKNPVHPDLVRRLKDGVEDENWVLNAIRFRIADPSSNDISIENEEATAIPQLVKAQIKLNYELDRYAAKTDHTIASASFIHSIAINDKYIGEFVKDVFNINQNPEASGCQILAILNKYIRSKDLPRSQPARGSYFFLHTNIFDTQSDINEWRFTEHKFVSNDLDEFNSTSHKIKRAYLLKSLVKDEYKSSIQDLEITNDTVDDAISNLEPKVPEALKDIQGGRVVRGAHDSNIGSVPPSYALRIVSMQFPRSYVSDSLDNLIVATDKQPLNIWFSGTLTDFGRNSRSQDLNYDLVTFLDGTAVPSSHPARLHEQTKTCAQCHASTHDTSFDPKTFQIREVASMNFRHIGFGDGGNRRCNPFFGLVRTDYTAALSTYLLKTANGFSMNNYSPKAVRASAPAMPPFAQFNAGVFASETGIDVVRCFNIDGTKDGAKP